MKIPISNGDSSITPTETSPRIPISETKPSKKEISKSNSSSTNPKSRKNEKEQPPTPSSSDKMSDFFAKIDLGIKSSKTRLENANTSGILDRFEDGDLKNDYGGYIKL